MRNTLLASLLIAFVALFSSQQALATGYKYHNKASYKSHYTPYYKKSSHSKHYYKKSSHSKHYYKKSSHSKHYYKKSSHKKHNKKKYHWVKPRPVSAC